MFIEPHLKEYRKGWIEVICGSMFSGKTEELIRRLKRVKFTQQKVEIFKPQVGTRYDEEDIVSHDESAIRSTPVSSSQNILLLSNDIDVVGIDEAQFFDNGLTNVCEQLAERGIRVIAAGLDMDYKGVPFDPMPQLLAIADYVTKVHAICMCCGDLATHSYRKTESEVKVLLGETDIYEPRCRKCYANGMEGR